ncbi:predicted protein [Naegleria gruberi]|uniref:Predicted protein n=1 Tax=Naegleria gruberi TaxID=5762 RepID=D2VIQ1_NAEGR|nr:uncharacterized protein NAEGRDRAFT_34385 [Naegleria gruberi]EFC43313.1 predicted protein [Naegleria gruberi]|eukprot:XP_002676057.1 predicted protein [Naegleria gruberi strain NEG-M]
MQNEYFKSYSGTDYIPGRPELPILLDDMKRIPTTYKQAGVSLPVFLLHNMAHIELNAIDLCWNTIVMALLHPIRYKSEWDITDNTCLDLFDFINDFIKVAKDEARHFSDLSQRLVELSSYYGAVTSHKAIWSMARDTQYSLLERVVIGNMVLEGRGLDSGERLISKMIGCGDMKSCAIVKTICHEEEDHVRIGVKWFDKMARITHALMTSQQEEDNLSKLSFDDFQTELFQQIVLTNYGPLPSPFNHDSRKAANMKECWYEDIARPKITKTTKTTKH